MLGSPSPGLSLDGSKPICIPSPYTDLGHDFTTIPFYSPTIFSYAGPSISDCPSVHQSLSPSLFWPGHGHMGAPIPLHHHAPARPQHGQAIQSPWVDLAPRDSVSTNSKSARRRSQEGEEGVVSSGGKADLHYCAVCHDYASGYHYGVWSCEGCKAFFKRSIQGHNDYICPATNQCTIDKNRRKSCQACRLRKCYEVGMTKCGMRKEQGTYRNPKTRRLTRLSAQGRANGPKALTGPAGGLLIELQPPALTPEQLIKRIMEAEPPDIFLMKDMSGPLTEANVMMSLTNLADKELVHMISWAKKIPGFCTNLPTVPSPGFVELGLLDQVHLLECCWLEVLMMGLMWRSVAHPGKLIFSPDLSLSRNTSSQTIRPPVVINRLNSTKTTVDDLRYVKYKIRCYGGNTVRIDERVSQSCVHWEHRVLMSAFSFPTTDSSTLTFGVILALNMCLSSSEGSEEPQSRSKLLHLLDAVTDALVWAIARTGLTFRQQYTRLAHLLMLLSHIRHVSNKGMDHLHCMKMKNMVPLYDLLLEMLDAHIMHSSRLPRQASPPPECADLGEVAARPPGSTGDAGEPQ
ncbi:hypothetical protein F2P81_024418 [Scophthalmus maximus]|uniref:Estrogen receptor beta n=1 Tax=Scophthalmus maximus TaxID=52904 RepID=A0A6A4RUS9_SCOMX|nr:hypothetical protein F2P81_024418 [Scophthalmus maximus]